MEEWIGFYDGLGVVMRERVGWKMILRIFGLIKWKLFCLLIEMGMIEIGEDGRREGILKI